MERRVEARALSTPHSLNSRYRRKCSAGGGAEAGCSPLHPLPETIVAATWMGLALSVDNIETLLNRNDGGWSRSSILILTKQKEKSQILNHRRLNNKWRKYYQKELFGQTSCLLKALNIFGLVCNTLVSGRGSLIQKSHPSVPLHTDSRGSTFFNSSESCTGSRGT